MLERDYTSETERDKKFDSPVYSLKSENDNVMRTLHRNLLLPIDALNFDQSQSEDDVASVVGSEENEDESVSDNDRGRDQDVNDVLTVDSDQSDAVDDVVEDEDDEEDEEDDGEVSKVDLDSSDAEATSLKEVVVRKSKRQKKPLQKLNLGHKVQPVSDCVQREYDVVWV